MSAECYDCGSDLVYPVGKWPIGECPVCSQRQHVLALTAALQDALKLLEWDGEYDQAMQWRDWQTCDLLLDEQGRSPLRDRVIEKARKALGATEAAA